LTWPFYSLTYLFKRKEPFRRINDIQDTWIFARWCRTIGQKTYIPHLQQLEEKGRAKLMAIVEVDGNEHLRPSYSHLEFLFVAPFETMMPSGVHLELELTIHGLRIDYEMISTKPLAHKSYGLRTLEKGLNVITDKSIITRKGACTSKSAASGIAEDFEELQNAYDELQSRSRPASRSSVTEKSFSTKNICSRRKWCAVSSWRIFPCLIKPSKIK
jgi:hypothetical protein